MLGDMNEVVGEESNGLVIEDAKEEGGAVMEDASEIPTTELEDVSKRPSLEPQKSRDRYGFVLHINSAESRRGEAEKLQLQNIEIERTKKWLKMLANWDKTMTFKSEKLKRRLRKGVPDPVRGEVWKKLARVDDTKRIYRDAYNISNISNLDEKVRDEIERDINRTFPGHDLFDSKAWKDGRGQVSLRRILQLYAAFDKETGYCQGMGFVAAMFLTYMVEEDAFFALIALLQRPSFPLRAMYCPGMPGTKRVLAVYAKLCERYVPTVWSHLEREGIHHSMFATSWFMTLYASSFPFDLVTKVFDVLWFEGWKIVYRVAVALLKYSEERILESSFEDIMFYFRELPVSVDHVRLWEIVWALPMKREVIDAYDVEYSEEERRLSRERVIR